MNEKRKYCALSIICAYLALSCIPPYLLTIGRLVIRTFRMGAFADTFVLLLAGVCGALGIVKLYALARLQALDCVLDRLPHIVPLAMFVGNIALAIVKYVTKIRLLGTILTIETALVVIWMTIGFWAYFRYQSLVQSCDSSWVQNTKIISTSELNFW